MPETITNNQQESQIDPASNGKSNPNSKRVIGIILSIVMIALTVFVLNLQHQNSNSFQRSVDMTLNSSSYQAANYRSYVQQYKDTKVQLEETTRKLEEVNHQLDQVTAELATTKGMLTQTQTMLVGAQEENNKLKQELVAYAREQLKIKSKIKPGDSRE